MAVTNESGAVIERTNYEPYGNVIGGTPKDGPGYTGHVLDTATGLNYMQQRYYDPSIGRFLSVDPVTANSGTGANFNRYWYANNNPYKFTDPDGRQARTGGSHPEGDREERLRKLPPPPPPPPCSAACMSQRATSDGHGRAPKNYAGTIASGQALISEGGGVATNRAAHNLAKYGWQAGEDAAMWKGMSRTLGRFSNTLNFGQNFLEVRNGLATGNMTDVGHGATGIVFGLVTLGAPEISLAGSAIDFGVQQIEYQPRNGPAGQTVAGWSVIPAVARDVMGECTGEGCP